MGIKDVRDKVSGALAGAFVGARAIRESIALANEAELSNEKLEVQSKESLASIELSLDDLGWREMSGQWGRWIWRRSFLRQMTAMSRLMYLMNPLIHRAVTVQELYVWGGGVEIESKNRIVQEVLDDFFENRNNQKVIGEAWPEREREQRIDGNTFFALYRNKTNGSARIRLFPADQIEEIYCNPQDVKEPWYYRRCTTVNPDGTGSEEATLYPCMDYDPATKPTEYQGVKIDWDVRILHLATGGLSQMKFGMPEIFSGLNWATAYKKILENFATILASYARMAMKMTGAAGKKGIAASKSKLNTALTGNQFVDTNPPPNTAAWAVLSGGMDVKAIKTSNSTTAPDEARALRSMVACAGDVPEHFFGDSDIGNFATSATLDRPTELKMVSRQQFWVFVILRLSDKLKEWSAVAPQGKLRKAGFGVKQEKDVFDGTRNVVITLPSDVTPKQFETFVKFPNILERDVVDRVRAVVQAATLGGSHAEGIIPDRAYLCKLLLEALDEEDVDAMMEELYPDTVKQGFIDPADLNKQADLAAQGKADLGTAALDQAAAAAKVAANPKPSPPKAAPVSKSPAKGGRGKR